MNNHIASASSFRNHDALTAEERRLINEAVAAGRVRKIPRGVSAFNQVWDEDRQRYIYVCQITGEERDNPHKFAHSAARARKRGLSKARLTRREQIRDMRERGLSSAAMAAVLGVSENTVDVDLRALGVEPKPQSQAARRKKIEQFRAIIAAEPDIPRIAVAERLGVTPTTASDYAKEVGHKYPGAR